MQTSGVPLFINNTIFDFRHLIESDVEACRALTCDIPYPRTYVIYKLRGEAIDLDGKLDEKAWKNVGWTDSFVGECLLHLCVGLIIFVTSQTSIISIQNCMLRL